jgi:cell division protein FtsI (penicillin-binding protein 3)
MTDLNRRCIPVQVIKWRFWLLFGIFSILSLILLMRAFNLQVWHPEILRQQNDMRTLRLVAHESQRGLILDRHGEILAASVPLRSIWIDPKQIKQTQSLQQLQRWKKVAHLLELNIDKLVSRIQANSDKRYIYLKRQVLPSTADEIKALNIQGVYFKSESKRFYPSGEVNAPLLGVTNIDDRGIEGLEKYFDDSLVTTPIQQHVRKARDGQVVEHLQVTQAGQQPHHIELSLDQRIQALAYLELKKAMKLHQATSGSVVVLDVQTGEILAMANAPSYNPNDPKQRQSYRMRNRAIADTYEPGSVIKPFVILAGLEAGVILPMSKIDVSPGHLRVGHKLIKDYRNYGEIDLATILKKSSNVGVTKVALSMPVQDLLSVYGALGVGETSELRLLGEAAGQLDTRSRWSKLEHSTLSFGYGFTMTALQLTRMYATLANHGVMMPLAITKQAHSQAPGRQVVSAKAADAVLSMLLNTTDIDGTARQGHVEGYQVAGKTGTSRKAVAGGYGDDYVVSFAGVAPYNNPQVAIGVVINDPKGDHYYGGDVAAPVFAKVMTGVLQLLNVPQSHYQKNAIQPFSLGNSANQQLKKLVTLN